MKQPTITYFGNSPAIKYQPTNISTENIFAARTSQQTARYVRSLLKVCVVALCSMALMSTTLASGYHHHHDKSGGANHERYEVGYTNVWVKDDTRSFDPPLDWVCASQNQIDILDANGSTDCDVNGDGFNNVVSEPRGKRTLPIRILYPIMKKHAHPALKPTISEVLYNGSVEDCKARITSTTFPYISFGFGYNFNFTTQVPDGDFSKLYRPETFTTDAMLTEYCTGRPDVFSDAKPAKGKFPLVTYSHGDNSPDIIIKELNNLVKSGYIVFMPLHVGDGPIYMPPLEVLGERVTPDLAARITSTGMYPNSEEIKGGALGLAEQEIKRRAEDMLVTVDFASKVNATGKPSTLLLAQSKKTLKKLKRHIDMDRVGFFGSSNGGITGLTMLPKTEFATIYKAAIIHIAAQTRTPLQLKVQGQFLADQVPRNDVLRSDGYLYNSDVSDDPLVGDAITHSVPMMTYIGIEDDLFILTEWCGAGSFCTNNAPGNGRPANFPSLTNLHPLHVNGVVLGAISPQYLLNISNLDHSSVYVLDFMLDTPSIQAVAPSQAYKESVWNTLGNYVFLPSQPPFNGFQTRYPLIDRTTIIDVGNFYTRTWMDLYLKDKLCSNKKDVKIRDSDGNVLVTVPKEWNNLKILKSVSAFAPANVHSAAYNNLTVGLGVGGSSPEDVVCKRGKHKYKHKHH